MKLGPYYASIVTTDPRWQYDLAKPAHVALASLAIVALSLGHVSLLVAACIAAALYFGVGKLLVAVELIPHGAHKPLAHETVRWIAEMAVIGLVPAMVWTPGVPYRLPLVAVGCLVVYAIASTILAGWQT